MKVEHLSTLLRKLKMLLQSCFSFGYFRSNSKVNSGYPSIYKNLLQESLQKKHSCLPTYTTVHVGQPHIPVFFSTVEIQGETFRGQEAKTKKQAEMNVAKVAYIALTERKFKKDDEQNAVGATAHIRETPKSSFANIPVVGATTSSKNVRSDAKPMSEKQIRSVEGTTSLCSKMVK